MPGHPLPVLYSELEDPSPKLVKGYTGARLILSFHVYPEKELLNYDVEPYLTGVFDMFEQQLHDFGIISSVPLHISKFMFKGVFGIVAAQSLVLPCCYRDVVLGQFFFEQILKVCHFVFKPTIGATFASFSQDSCCARCV